MAIAGALSYPSLGLSLMEPNRVVLQFKRHFAIDGETAYSTAWLGDDMAVGANKGFLIINSVDGKKEKKKMVPPNTNISSVQSVGKFALAALCKVSKKKMETRLSCPHSLSNRESIVHEFEEEDEFLTHMAISDTYIAICGLQRKSINVIDRKTKHSLAVGSGKLQRPYGVLLQQNHVVVGDLDMGCVFKYKLEKNSEPEWICEGLQSPSGICEDKDGYLYVASNDGKVIYLLSPQGDFLCLCLVLIYASFRQITKVICHCHMWSD